MALRRFGRRRRLTLLVVMIALALVILAMHRVLRLQDTIGAGS